MLSWAFQTANNVNSNDIASAVRRFFSDSKYLCENTYVYLWESDVFFITKAGFSVEVEIKVSKQDFKRDFSKQKHLLLANHKASRLLLKDYEGPYGDQYRGERRWENARCTRFDILTNEQIINRIPNRFYFAMPEGLVEPSEVPKYCGVLWVGADGRINPDRYKLAPILHRTCQDHRQVLLDRFYYNNMDLRSRITMLQNEIGHLKKGQTA